MAATKKSLILGYDDAVGLRDGYFTISDHGLEIGSKRFTVPPVHDAPDWINHYQNFWLAKQAYEIPANSEITFACSFSSCQLFSESPLPRDVLKCVNNIHEDIRLCAGSFQIIDPNSGLFFGFSQTDDSLMAIYGSFENFPMVEWAGGSSNLNFAAWKSTAEEEEKERFSAFVTKAGCKVAVASDSWSQVDPEILKLWEEWRRGGAISFKRRAPRCYYPHGDRWAGKKASFVGGVEVARREGASPLAQFDDTAIIFRTTSTSSGLIQTVHFKLRGQEVFRVLQPGRRPAEEFRLLEHGGYAVDLTVSRVVIGFGITSMLDASRPNNYSRKGFKCDYRLKTGLVQLAHHHRYYEIYQNYFGELENVEPAYAFAINDFNSENDMKKALFGQGCIMKVKRFLVTASPIISEQPVPLVSQMPLSEPSKLCRDVAENSDATDTISALSAVSDVASEGSSEPRAPGRFDRFELSDPSAPDPEKDQLASEPCLGRSALPPCKTGSRQVRRPIDGSERSANPKRTATFAGSSPIRELHPFDKQADGKQLPEKTASTHTSSSTSECSTSRGGRKATGSDRASSRGGHRAATLDIDHTLLTDDGH